jgi:hypothetical protein
VYHNATALASPSPNSRVVGLSAGLLALDIASDQEAEDKIG